MYLGHTFLGFFLNFEKFCQVQNNCFKWKFKEKSNLFSRNLAWQNNHNFSHKSLLFKIWLRFTFSSLQSSVENFWKLWKSVLFFISKFINLTVGKNKIGKNHEKPVSQAAHPVKVWACIWMRVIVPRVFASSPPETA